MRSFRLAAFFLVVISIFTFTLAFARPASASYASPSQIRMIMFRMLDFFNDAIDSALPQSPGGTPQSPNNPPAGGQNPPLPTGSCPFQTTATIRECLDSICTTTRPISDFDNNQQYGIANDLHIQNKGDAPDPATSFGNTGKPGEVTISDGNQSFPTADGYQRADPVDIKVYLDANKDGVIDNDWQIVGKQCDSSGSVIGCPNGQSKYSSTAAPLDQIQTMIIDCGVNLRYGWLLRKTGVPTVQISPTTQISPPGRITPSGQSPTSPISPTSSPQGSISSADVKSIIDTLSQQSITTNLESIVDNDSTPEKDNAQTRFSTFPGFQTESAYVKKFFDDLGIQSQFQNFSLSGGQTRNIIATLPGTGPHKSEYYLVVAHLDSTSANSGPANDPAPGADDNGSGSVAVMEIAKAIKQSGKSFDYSMEFILFSGEEQGKLGSQYYVNNLAGKTIKGVINLDMISWTKNPGHECTTFGYRNYDGGNAIADTVKQINDANSLGLEVRVGPSSIDASDHGPFWSKNITAIFGYECDLLTSSGVSNPNYHKITDTTSYVNFSQLTKTAKAVAGAVVTLASQ